jgi:hypothetical protein
MLVLFDAAWDELHLLELGPDDVGQRAAGQRLADCLCTAGLNSAPSGHRHVLRARNKGLLEIDVASLQRMNCIAGIAVSTLPNDHVVSPEQVVAEAQITSLAIAARAIEEAEQIAREAAVVRLLPFVPRDAVVWRRDDRIVRPLSEKLEWFGCPVRDVLELPRDATSVRESMERQLESGATLFLVSGSNALDPLDPVFEALERMGATMQRIGMPVHPGTLLWIAAWRGVAIIGLPSCDAGPQVTAFDLVLPKLLAAGRVLDEEIAALGHGGILRRS